MSMNPDTSQPQATPLEQEIEPRKPYESPRLVRYGDIEELTSSGPKPYALNVDVVSYQTI
jgi:hypothetical protein